MIIGAALTERFLPKVEWAGQSALIDADRAVWLTSPVNSEEDLTVRERPNAPDAHRNNAQSYAKHPNLLKALKIALKRPRA